ncbi:MAG: hypothetical protein HY043_15935, partial [Verrucomicrobia bacterium]|nr:hypothetical protein [Verrucomicrobiota bacterium]
VINVQNQGLLLATGGTFTLDGAWQNAGTFALTNSTFNVNGNYTLANFGTINSSNTMVYLNGTLDNRNSILTLDESKVGWQLNTVTILGGTIQGVNGVPLTVAFYGTPTLDGVVLNADLVLNDSADPRVVNGLTFNGTCTLYGGINTTSLNFDGTQTLAGQCQINLAGPYDPVVRPVNGTLTIGPKVTIVGGYGIVGRPDLPLINQGTIRAENSSRAVQIVGSSVINSGTIVAVSGPIAADNLQNKGGVSIAPGGTLSLTGAWTNPGTISVTNGTLNVGGTYLKADFTAIQRHGGTINFNSVLDNRNDILFLDNNSDNWSLVDGTILGGTVNTATGVHLSLPDSARGKLDGVIYNGDIVLTMVSKLTITNGLTLNGQVTLAFYSAAIYLDGTQTLSGAGKFVFEGGVDPFRPRSIVPISGTVTIGASFTIEGGTGTLGNPGLPLVNLGTISVDGAGSTITIQGNPFINTGTTLELNGGKVVIVP